MVPLYSGRLFACGSTLHPKVPNKASMVWGMALGGFFVFRELGPRPRLRVALPLLRRSVAVAPSLRGLPGEAGKGGKQKFFAAALGAKKFCALDGETAGRILGANYSEPTGARGELPLAPYSRERERSKKIFSKEIINIVLIYFYHLFLIKFKRLLLTNLMQLHHIK